MGHADVKTTMRYLHSKSRTEDAALLGRAYASGAVERVTVRRTRESIRAECTRWHGVNRGRAPETDRRARQRKPGARAAGERRLNGETLTKGFISSRSPANRRSRCSARAGPARRRVRPLPRGSRCAGRRDASAAAVREQAKSHPGALTDAPLRGVELLDATHELDVFDCGVPALTRWLRQSARTAAATGTAATYVLSRDQRVIGYYALAMSSVAHERAPSRLRRGNP